MAEINELGALLGLMQQGFTPEQARQQLDDARAMQMAQMSGREMTRMGLIQGGQGLRRGLMAALGQENQDPTLQMASQVRQLGSQFDLTTADGMMQYARALQQVNPQMAQQAAARAQQMMVQEATLGKTRAQEAQARAGEQKTLAETAEVERKSAREQRIEEELAALPPDAPDSAVEAVVRKYGKPDQIFASIERRQKAEADRQARAELEREKIEARRLQQERDQEFRRQMAAAQAAMSSAVTSVQREAAALRLQELQDKRDEKVERKELAKQQATAHATSMLNTIQEAKSLVSPMTAGVGVAGSFIPTTDAYTLRTKINTIKANIGFDRLQQMREASPTGGALGQVAVQELNALQSTIASLDQGLRPSELNANLRKIEFHYNNWLRSTQGQPPLSREEFDKMNAPATPAAAPAAPAGGGWSIRPRQ